MTGSKRPDRWAGPPRSNFAGKNAQTLTQAANTNQRRDQAAEYRDAARKIARRGLDHPNDLTCRSMLAWASDWLQGAERMGTA